MATAISDVFFRTQKGTCNALFSMNLQDYNLKELHKNFTLENLEKALLNIFKLFKEGKNIKNENGSLK